MHRWIAPQIEALLVKLEGGQEKMVGSSSFILTGGRKLKENVVLGQEFLTLIVDWRNPKDDFV